MDLVGAAEDELVGAATARARGWAARRCRRTTPDDAPRDRGRSRRGSPAAGCRRPLIAMPPGGLSTAPIAIVPSWQLRQSLVGPERLRERRRPAASGWRRRCRPAARARGSTAASRGRRCAACGRRRRCGSRSSARIGPGPGDREVVLGVEHVRARAAPGATATRAPGPRGRRPSTTTRGRRDAAVQERAGDITLRDPEDLHAPVVGVGRRRARRAR